MFVGLQFILAILIYRTMWHVRNYGKKPSVCWLNVQMGQRRVLPCIWLGPICNCSSRTWTVLRTLQCIDWFRERSQPMDRREYFWAFRAIITKRFPNCAEHEEITCNLKKELMKAVKMMDEFLSRNPRCCLISSLINLPFPSTSCATGN